MEETWGKLNSTQEIVIKLLQQLVTVVYRPGTGYTALYSCFNKWLQCTDRVPATQPCTVASTTCYSVLTGYRLHSLVQLLQQLVTVCRPGTGYTLPTGHTACIELACFTLDGYRAFLSITNQHQESPTQRSSTSWPLLISSLFAGLRLMTGLIMCSPWQEVFSYTETASMFTELTNQLPAIQLSLSSFASHQLVKDTTNLLSGTITVFPLFNTGFRGPERTSRPSWGSAI